MSACTASGGGEKCDVAPQETCTNNAGGSSGTAVYDIQSNDPHCGDGPSFNTHNFDCDTSCSGSGPPSGGGGGQCVAPQEWGINCPAGTTRGTTVLNTACTRPTYCPVHGTAQANSGICCAWQYYPDECELVWQPNQGTYRRVCYPVPPDCLYNSTCTVDVVPQTIAVGNPVGMK